MLEALLQRLLDEDPEASLRREGDGFVLNVREPGEVWAEAFRPYKAELLALTRPLLGHKEVWRSLVAAFRERPEGPYEVHVDPVFGVPMALRVSRGHPVEAARRLLAEAPVYGLAVVKEDREVLKLPTWYWLGDLAPERLVRQQLKGLADLVLRARERGAVVEVAGKAREVTAGELVALHYMGPFQEA
ncbi:MAG: hypothetical protein ABDH20_03630 [Thermus sp.]